MADNTQYQDNQGDLDVPEQPLEQDFDTPAAPPDETDDALPKDHPILDTGLDGHEVYDEGVTNASQFNAQHVPSDEDEENGI
ncbi:MAG TPA: hypothetical protein VLA92_00805 [Candidatus Saccharimonadales bacterium]|nr:hypothetical protein [Candidatus Saccharimonadales bacterium]